MEWGEIIMAVTEESICNMALSRLGANLVTDLAVDDTIEADVCNANYDLARDFVLEARDWTFARKRSTPTIDGTAPSGWGARFPIPSDCLTLRRVSHDPKLYPGMDWEREEDWIYCNQEVIYIAYTYRLEDMTKFSPSFLKTLSYRLEADMAIALTESTKKELAAEQKYEVAIDRAGGLDGMQGVSRKARASTITGARFGGSNVRYDEDYLV